MSPGSRTVKSCGPIWKIISKPINGREWWDRIISGRHQRALVQGRDQSIKSGASECVRIQSVGEYINNNNISASSSSTSLFPHTCWALKINHLISMSSFSSSQTACAIPVVGNWEPSSSHTNISSSTYNNNHSKSILLEAPERNTDTHTQTDQREWQVPLSSSAHLLHDDPTAGAAAAPPHQIKSHSAIQFRVSSPHDIVYTLSSKRQETHCTEALRAILCPPPFVCCVSDKGV